MLAPARAPSKADFEGLGEGDWRAISQMVRQHRLGPMMDYRAAAAQESWPVPDAVRSVWRADRKNSAFQALKFERALINIARNLAASGIEFAALKGSWLAWHAYPEPALRPMRDIDILVEYERALATWDALLAAGFSPLPENSESLEQAMRANKHLPAIRSDRDGVVIEIHLRLTNHGAPQNAARNARPEWDARERGEIKGEVMCCLNAADALLHLIVHSAYDNRFNNGPVIFDDIAFILQNCTVDWDRFWSRADVQGWTNGCQLLLQLTAFQHGAFPISWPSGGATATPPDILSAALQLCLQDSRHRGNIMMMGEAAQTENKASSAGYFLRRFSVSRDRLAPLIGVNPESWLALTAYPLWLWAAGSRAVRGLALKSARDDAERRTELVRWLG